MLLALSGKKMSWERFQRYYLPIETLGFALDVSRMDFSESYIEAMEPRMQRAFKAMQEMEGGSIALKAFPRHFLT